MKMTEPFCLGHKKWSNNEVGIYIINVLQPKTVGGDKWCLIER